MAHGIWEELENGNGVKIHMVSEVSKGLMLCVSVSCPDFIGKTKGTKDRRDLPKSQKSVS